MNRLLPRLLCCTFVASLATASSLTNTPAATPAATNTPAATPTAPSLPIPPNSLEYPDVSAFIESLLLIQNYHVEQVSSQRLLDAAIQGMLQFMDPNSAYLSPGDLKRFDDAAKNIQTDVGIVLNELDGKKIVQYPRPNSPAFVAGILAFDEILQLNGEDVAPWSLDALALQLEGEPNSVIVLKLRRKGVLLPFDVTLKRTAYTTPSVQNFHITPEGYLYLYIENFTNNSAAEFYQALPSFLKQNPKGIILDLRNNPGGNVPQAEEIAFAFLPKGATVYQIRQRAPQPKKFVCTVPGHPFITIPVAVLINDQTASAAEILACALQQNAIATTIGETTFGKSSIQSVIQLQSRPDAAVRLTTHYYYTPNGDLIQGQGLKPTIFVAQSPSDFARARLQQLVREYPQICATNDLAEIQAFNDEPLDRAKRLLNAHLHIKADQAAAATNTPPATTATTNAPALSTQQP